MNNFYRVATLVQLDDIAMVTFGQVTMVTMTRDITRGLKTLIELSGLPNYSITTRTNTCTITS